MSIPANGKVVVDRAQRLYSASRKLAEEGTSKARAFIVEKPLWSTLIGCAAGFGLGMIFRSRS